MYSVNTNALSLNSVDVSPKLTSKSRQLGSFDNLPEQGRLFTQNSFKVEGKADNNSVIVAANRVRIMPIVVKGGSFSEDFRLKPGVNEVVLYESNKEKEQLKIIKLFYLELTKETLSEDKEATDEADILKAKLQAKVLELRNKPRSMPNESAIGPANQTG